MRLYDAHNHLQDAWLAPHRSQVFKDLARVPLAGAVVNGTCEQDWPDVRALAAKHAFVRPSFGLHPWNVGNATPAWRDTLQRTLDACPAGAIGEIGLDRWILTSARHDDSRLAGLQRAPLSAQVDAFRWQLGLATERNLPVTIHCLDAWGALAECLQETQVPARGFLLHAYGGSLESAREFAALGAYFSFNGYFLKDAGPPGSLRAASANAVPRRLAVFAELPLERLLVETDAPAMPLPESWREHRLAGLADGNPINHPANIGAVYRALAELRGIAVDVLADRIQANFCQLFGQSGDAA